MSKKSKAFTAFLATTFALVIINSIFWFGNNASPLDKSIEVTFEYADHTPIEGLSVELWDGLDGPGLIETNITHADGKVTFAGLADNTYTWKWSWQGVADEHLYEIDCSKIVWNFTETLDYWTLSKTFTYGDGTAIVGLYVTMDGWAGYTDASGTIGFSNIEAGDYTLEWIWQGETQTEPVPTIGFDTPSPVDMDTNVLPYWTVCKTFEYEDGTAIVGLDVTLGTATLPTNDFGTVCFDELKIGDYTLEWSWQGVSATHPFSIAFDTPSPYDLGINELDYWTVCKTFEYEDGTAIVGLDVTLGTATLPTNDFGTVCFIVKAGTYTLEWSWQGVADSHGPFTIDFQTPSPVIIDTNVLDYWIIEKQFYYQGTTTPPAEELDVTLVGVGTKTTVAGFVSFADLKAGDYTIEWIWGGDLKTEPVPIVFGTESPIILTNDLESKSGGGKIE